MGLSGPPPADGIVAQARRFGLTTLPPDATQAPMLVINGDADRFIPAQDTNCFQGRRRTEVRILSGAGHCASNRPEVVVSTIAEWAGRILGHQTGAGVKTAQPARP